MYGHESGEHGDNHGDDTQAEQKTEDEGGGACHFAEDSQTERPLATDTQRVGEGGRQLGVGRNFTYAVYH